MDESEFKKMVERISEEYEYGSDYSQNELERILAKYEFGSYPTLEPEETEESLRSIFANLRFNERFGGGSLLE